MDPIMLSTAVHRASAAVSDHPPYPHRLAWIADSVEKPKCCWGPHGFNYGLRPPPSPPRLAWVADSSRKAHVFWGPHGFNCGLRARHKLWLKHPRLKHPPRFSWFADSGRSAHVLLGGNGLRDQRTCARLRPKCPCCWTPPWDAMRRP